MSIDKNLYNIFIEELNEHLKNIRASLNTYFETEDNTVFRKIIKDFHTLKGSSAILGLKELTDIFHELENYFNKIKNNLSKSDKIKIVQLIELIEKIPSHLENPEEISKQINGILYDKKNTNLNQLKPSTEIKTQNKVDPVKINSLKKDYFEISNEIHQLLEGLNIEKYIKNRIYKKLESLGYKLNRLNLSSFSILDEKIKNIAYSTSSQLNKKVKILIENSEIEADTEIINIVNEALTHLIRNAIYHGIEKPEERKKLKKDEVGLITIRYTQSNDRIQIIVEDDGKGIDLEKILKKAIEEKIIGEEDLKHLKEDDIINLIFSEKISTAETVDEISGRGIGMQIIKDKIESIGGLLEIETEKNKFTRFLLNVPFTFQSILSKIVSSNNYDIAIPITFIDIVEKFKEDKIIKKGGNFLYQHRNKLFKVVSLANLLNMDSKKEKFLIFFKNANSALLSESIKDNVLLDIINIKGFSGQYKYFIGFSIYKNKPIAIIRPSELDIDQNNNFIKSGYQQPITNSNKTLLITDDNKIILETLSNILKEKYNIIKANNGIEALNILKSNKVDLLITDIEMPEMDGFTLISKIRKNNQKIPILILSSRGEKSDIQKGLELGANAYFVKKDFNKNDLIKKVEELL